MARIDADALETFLAVHRHGGFSAAAKALHRTQPAISRRLALLEQDLGGPLFERMVRGSRLSQAGRVLLPLAEKAVAAMHDAERAVMALTREDAGPVALAVVGTLADGKLTSALRDLRVRHEDLDVSLETATSRRVSERVTSGDADIGLRYGFDPNAELDSRHLAPEPLVIICAPDHRMAGRRIEQLTELRAERWLAFPSAPDRPEASSAHIFGLFFAYGLGEVAWSAVDSLTAQKRLVEAGYGPALVPRSSVTEELARGTLAVIDVADIRPVQPVTIVTRRGGFLSRGAMRLIELLETIYGKTGPL